jgi:chitin disaccharide deacetylase
MVGWRLFVNADDFGLTDGVTEGIVAAMEAGLVGGTTAMVCAAGAVDRLRRQAPALAGRVGLHLQLTGGRPCLPPAAIRSLVGPDGAFPRKKIAVGQVEPDEVRQEWREQLARLRACGIEPSHLDAHHHIHKRPDVWPLYLELARELKVPARALTDDMRRALDRAGVPHADSCLTEWFGQGTSSERFLALVEQAAADLPEGGAIEVMTHPGRCDATLAAISTYAQGREIELGVLRDPGLSSALAARGIAVIGPGAVAALAI